MKRLPDTELEVMKALWSTGPDTPRSVLEDKLTPFGWASNTVNTYLARLADKGFVSVRREGKSNLYTPLISQDELFSLYLEDAFNETQKELRNFGRATVKEINSKIATVCPFYIEHETLYI